jgi:hypothetical protein
MNRVSKFICWLFNIPRCGSCANKDGCRRISLDCDSYEKKV